MSRPVRGKSIGTSRKMKDGIESIECMVRAKVLGIISANSRSRVRTQLASELPRRTRRERSGRRTVGRASGAKEPGEEGRPPVQPLRGAQGVAAAHAQPPRLRRRLRLPLLAPARRRHARADRFLERSRTGLAG